MDDNNQVDDGRRTFMKGAATTGVAATGLGVFGSASAQPNVRNLNVDISGGLVNIRNINILRNVDVGDVIVTVIDGDVNVNIEDVLNDLNIEFDDVQVINVEAEDVLNDNFVQVAVAVLGSAGNLVAAGSDAVDQ